MQHANTAGQKLKSKCGGDTFDHMCSAMKCNRKTRRWLMAVFFNYSCNIYNHKLIRRNVKLIKRKEFIKKIHEKKITPWFEQFMAVKAIFAVDFCMEALVEYEPITIKVVHMFSSIFVWTQRKWTFLRYFQPQFHINTCST